MNANKRHRQQNGTGQLETYGNKTEHIETSHQWEGTRKARKLERKRDGNGMRTGRERDGTGRGQKRYGDGNGRERDVNGAGTGRERDGNGMGTGRERDGNGTKRD